MLINKTQLIGFLRGKLKTPRRFYPHKIPKNRQSDVKILLMAYNPFAYLLLMSILPLIVKPIVKPVPPLKPIRFRYADLQIAERGGLTG